MITNLQNEYPKPKEKSLRSSPPTANNLTLAHTNVHHARRDLLALIFLVAHTATPATPQPVPPPPGQANKKSVTGIMVVVAILFFISGLVSLYTRQCADRSQPRIRGGRLDHALPMAAAAPAVGDPTRNPEASSLTSSRVSPPSFTPP